MNLIFKKFSFLNKINFLLSKKSKKKYFFIYLSFVFISILELVGISLIPVYFLFLIKTGDYKIFDNFEFLNKFINNISNNELILYSSFILFFIFFFKNLFFFLANKYHNKFTAELVIELSNKIYNFYIQMPYNLYLLKNSSYLVNNLTYEISNFRELIKDLVLVLREITFLLFFILFLFFYNFIVTFFIFLIMSFLSFIFFLIIKKPIAKKGLEVSINKKILLNNLKQCFDLFKIVKIFNIESDLKDTFNKTVSNSERYQAYMETLSSVPKYFLEVFVVLLLVIILQLSVIANISSSEIISLSIVIAIASVRLVPIFSSISRCLTKIRFRISSAEILYKEITQYSKFPEIADESISFTENKEELKNININFKDVDFFYIGSTNYVLSKVNINIGPNAIIGIVGDSGSGKTTFLDLFTGLLKPSSGQILLNGASIDKNLKSWQKKIAIIPQEIFLLDDSIKNNIFFFKNQNTFREKNYKEVLRISKLQDFINTLDKKDDTLIGENGSRLSGGQKQRIGIARALYHNKSILILDEATNALDSNTEDKIINDISLLKDGRIIFIVSHKYKNLRHCDKIFIFKNTGIKIANYSDLMIKD